MVNKSKKTSLELAEIHLADLLKNGLNPNPHTSGRAFFDAGLVVQYILPFPFCVGNQSNDLVRDLLEDGFFDEIIGHPVEDHEELSDLTGFVIHAELDSWDWSDTTFGEDGCMDHCMGSSGRYLITAYGNTLPEAYTNLFQKVVQTTAKSIEVANR